MMFLRTDFKMHANWQGYDEEPTTKYFIGRKACTIALSEAQRTHWNATKCMLGIVAEITKLKEQVANNTKLK
jgi:hypothetical protein